MPLAAQLSRGGERREEQLRGGEQENTFLTILEIFRPVLLFGGFNIFENIQAGQSEEQKEKVDELLGELGRKGGQNSKPDKPSELGWNKEGVSKF